MTPTQLFKALSDNTRLRCLCMLVSAEELCVCELTHATGLAQPKVSHHLAALRKAGLVSDRKQGLWIHYRINEQLPTWAIDVIRTAAEGIRGQEPYIRDVDALAEMNNRQEGLCG